MQKKMVDVKQQFIVSCPFCYANGKHFFRKTYAKNSNMDLAVEIRKTMQEKHEVEIK